MPHEVTMPSPVETRRGPEKADQVRADQVRADQVQSTASMASGSTGRVRHEDKITVYISREELVRLEQARLVLRAEHGLAVDRGRLVREAVAAALDDLDVRGADADLLQRLAGS